MAIAIIACALAILVPLAVGLALLMWATSSFSLLRHDIEVLRAQIERASTAQLRVELDALAAAVDKVTLLQRKQYGKLWGELTQIIAPQASGGAEQSNGAAVDDAELAAMLALQTAAPAK